MTEKRKNKKRLKRLAEEPKLPITSLPNPVEDYELIEKELRALELIRERLRAEMVKTALEMDAKREKHYIV